MRENGMDGEEDGLNFRGVCCCMGVILLVLCDGMKRESERQADRRV